jgi:hypothetical protein
MGQSNTALEANLDRPPRAVCERMLAAKLKGHVAGNCPLEWSASSGILKPTCL